MVKLGIAAVREKVQIEFEREFLVAIHSLEKENTQLLEEINQLKSLMFTKQ